MAVSHTTRRLLSTSPPQFGQYGLLHGEGHEEVDGVADLDAVEAGGGHADHGHRTAVDGNGLVENARVPSEPALPEAMAQHHERMGSWSAVVVRPEHATQGRA